MATYTSGHAAIWAVLCLVFVAVSADEDHGSAKNVYDAEMFKVAVDTKPHFIMFFAPWCGHCKRLAPTWDDLGDLYNNDDSTNVYIAKVDCTAESKLCKEHQVTGYPTLKFFKSKEEEPIRYKGKRDLDSLKTFVADSLSAPAAKPQPPEPTKGLYELTDENFKEHIAKGNHFIKFYAPWCGHCKKLAPTWEQLADGLAHSGQDVTICKVDCTVHKEVCSQYNVKGYPTLKWFKDGQMVDDYKQARHHETLKKYVSDMVKGKEEKKEESKVLVLTPDTFKEKTATGLAFVKFFAPWCAHCKKVAPIWEELAAKFEGKAGVTIADIDCVQYKDFCTEHKVKGYPTLLAFKNGEMIEKYTQKRTLEDFTAYVHQKLRDEL